MIAGIGTDLCDTRRIAEVSQRFGDRFARRILAEGEYATWQRRSARHPERGVRYLATRFAAKEAFSKAIGLGLHDPMRWRWCEVITQPSGAPVLRLHADLQTWFATRGWRAHISLCDEGHYALAFCVVEATPG